MIDLWRLSGAGNDFLAIVDPEQDPPAGAIRDWCRRGVSLGADGFFALRSGDPVEMTYWNADGGEAALCLNGSRCAAQLAFHLGWAGDRLSLATGAGVLSARRLDASHVELEVPILPEGAREIEVEAGGIRRTASFLRVGVPHLVVPWEGGLSTCPVAEVGPGLRSLPELGPQGANVHFVAWPEPSILEIRSFERGVEAETLACGTGVLAATAVGIHEGSLRFPVTARTRGGFDLIVAGRTNGSDVASWSLAGDARVLAECRVLPGAGSAPSPRWQGA